MLSQLNPKTRGRFIVFEGIDGSGKSTQARLLAEYLQFTNKQVYLTREPTTRPIGVLIRQALSGDFEVAESTMAAMFLADRLDHIQNDVDGILKALGQGIDVITDRYFWSSFAYHSLTLDMEWVVSIHKKVMELCPPDITIYLDLEVANSLQRIDNRNEATEIFENEETLTKVSNNYKEAFSKYGKGMNIKFINANQKIDTIQQEIRKALI